MAVSRALRRLLRIRDLEEEQGKIALETALGELHRLESALTATTARDRRGRRLVESSAHSGQLADRQAGIEEVRTAKRHAELLGPRIESKGEEVAERRQEYLEKRVERRQAETLISETEARDAVESNRRSQQGIDDWYRNRLHRKAGEVERAPVTVPCEASSGPLPAEEPL